MGQIYSLRSMNLLEELPINLAAPLTYFIAIDVTSQIPILQNHSSLLIAKIVPLMKAILVEKGQKLYHWGDCADEVYFLCYGKAFHFSSTGEQISTFGDNEIIGIEEVLDRSHFRRGSVIAQTPLMLYFLPAIHLYEIMRTFPEFAAEIEEIDYIRRTKEQMIVRATKMGSHVQTDKEMFEIGTLKVSHKLRLRHWNKYYTASEGARDRQLREIVRLGRRRKAQSRMLYTVRTVARKWVTKWIESPRKSTSIRKRSSFVSSSSSHNSNQIPPLPYKAFETALSQISDILSKYNENTIEIESQKARLRTRLEAVSYTHLTLPTIYSV
eukprot:TRINITY_DN3906_c0_g1_i6.p1 TRINITY_DN3906_c0_g1~~TRINITY_DN3906_c0_g1_i6.p1  ORF type:complete len:326 (+),score=23.23 TRINITY_DN3906_c0_g1_i6:187-1164(+)